MHQNGSSAMLNSYFVSIGDSNTISAPRTKDCFLHGLPHLPLHNSALLVPFLPGLEMRPANLLKPSIEFGFGGPQLLVCLSVLDGHLRNLGQGGGEGIGNGFDTCRAHVKDLVCGDSCCVQTHLGLDSPYTVGRDTPEPIRSGRVRKTQPRRYTQRTENPPDLSVGSVKCNQSFYRPDIISIYPFACHLLPIHHNGVRAVAGVEASKNHFSVHLHHLPK